MKANKFINLFLAVVFVFFTICQANSKMAGINHSHSRSQCYPSSKILATIGSGDLQISDTQNNAMTYSKVAKTKVCKCMEL